MKITEKELREMVKEAVVKKLSEGADFTAKRKVIHSAQQASMEFENEIVSLMNLADPDSMDPHVQKAYFRIVKEMEENIVRAVYEALTKLAGYPRKNEGNEGK